MRLAELGACNALLYLCNRALKRVSGSRIFLQRYYLMVQPVDVALPVPRRLGRDLEVRAVGSTDAAVATLPRPPDVLRARYQQDSTCLAAFRLSGEFAGFIWLAPGPYEEDEVRCRFLPQPEGGACWDYDLYVVPSARGGVTFTKLWGAALEHLRSRGFEWSASRISAFAPASLAAQKRLGDYYASGSGVPRDLDAARRWHEAAAAADPSMAIEIARSYLTGPAAVSAPQRGLEMLRTAAEAGHAAASTELGNVYAKGIGVPRDTAEAFRWYERGAEQGDAWAKLSLGNLYLAGEGVPQDKARAMALFRQAAERGLAPAMTMLGDLYALGDGVPQDAAVAARWIALGVGLGMTVGIVAGVYPASRASKLDPVDALRYE